MAQFRTAWSPKFNITLRNRTFNFGAGSAGLCAGQESGTSDYLLMDGVAINNNGGQLPFIWLDRNVAGPPVLQVKLNNVYNGVPLNNVAAINALVGSGVIRWTRGAVSTVVP